MDREPPGRRPIPSMRPGHAPFFSRRVQLETNEAKYFDAPHVKDGTRQNKGLVQNEGLEQGFWKIKNIRGNVFKAEQRIVEEGLAN